MKVAREYCVTMSRYNAWQNNQLEGFLQALDPVELARDRGAFFGSIMGTLNHLIWGDHLWVSRFDGGSEPVGWVGDGTIQFATPDAWAAERRVLDARIDQWAKGLRDNDLDGMLSWQSGATGQQHTTSLALCVAQFFNHQTHHRGQVHAMLTATGSKAPVSDLVYLPEDV
ncbi:MAG: DinB family protein [Sedimentitalea sp.]